MSQGSEVQRYKEALAASEQRFRVIFEQAAMGIALADTQGHYLDVNPALQDMLGYHASELIGKPFAQYTYPDDVADNLQLFRELVRGERDQYQLEKRYIRKDGSVFWGHLTVSIVRDASSRPQFTIAMLLDITERKEVEQKLRYLSTHDFLTELYNRAFFEEVMSRLENERDVPVTILIADIDGLKRVNDEHGHAAGDYLLKTAAQILRDAFSEDGVIARIGGDEFAVILPGVAASGAKAVVTHLRQTLETHNDPKAVAPLRMSVGAATAQPNDSLWEAMRQADRFMYIHKYASGNGHLGHQ